MASSILTVRDGDSPEDLHMPQNDNEMLAYLDANAQRRLDDLPSLRKMLDLRFEASDKSLKNLNDLLESFRVQMEGIVGSEKVSKDPRSADSQPEDLGHQAYGVGKEASRGFFGFMAGIFSGISSLRSQPVSAQKAQSPMLNDNQVKPRVEEFITLFLRAITDLENNIRPVAQMKERLEGTAKNMDKELKIMQAYLDANPRSTLRKRIEREMAQVQSGLVGVRSELRNLQDQLGARIISSATLQTQLPFIATNLVTGAMAAQGAAEIRQAQLTGECVRKLNEALAVLSAKETQNAVLGTIETAYSLPLSVEAMQRVHAIRSETGVRAAALVTQKESERFSGLQTMQRLLDAEPGSATRDLLGHTPEQENN